ncbi:MAG: winged helix-turn-helix transcriptional regulator [Treponema sp.]|nr:winged helix-turn-helix transcriptional regulator [Treponema sp.]
MMNTSKSSEKTKKVRRKSSEKKFGEKVRRKSSEIILELLKENPKLSAKKLSEKIGITSRAVEKQLASLAEKGFIKRIGSPKGGHWELVADMEKRK